MKIGLNLLLWTTHVTDQQYHLFDQLKNCQYDGVEIPVMNGDVSHYQKLASVIRDAGLDCTCSTALPGPDADPISSDKAIRQAGIDYLKWCIECVAAAGSKILCGPTYQALGHFTGNGPTTKEKQRLVDVHQLVADFAAQHNVTIATEPLNRFECYFLNTLSDGAEHTTAVGRENFGILFDTFHANIEEKDPIGVIAKHIHSIKHVHLSENDRGIPGQGHINFSETLSALKQGGYDGWIVVESFGRALPDLAAATCIWRDLFDSPQSVIEQSIAYLGPMVRE